MTFSLPTPSSPSLLKPRTLDLAGSATDARSLPIAEDPQASALDAALRIPGSVELDIADEACRHHIVERNLGQDPGPASLARLAGAILDPDTVQRG